MKKKTSSLLTGLIALGALFAVSFLWKYSIVLLIVLVALAAGMLLMKKSRREYKLFLISGVSGAVAEIIAIYFGAWQYTNPDLFSIPIWLIVLWGIAAVYISRLYQHIKD